MGPFLTNSSAPHVHRRRRGRLRPHRTSRAIRFGLLGAEQSTRAGDRLATIVAEAGYRITTGFAGTPVILDALSDTGHLDEAFKLLVETGCPSFLYPVTQGATTVWESWDAIRPDGTLHPSAPSLNHYALGAIADWLRRVIGGLEATEPGYRRMRIAPRPGGGLTDASVSHDTGYGPVSVAWRVEDARLILDVVVPSGTEATVVLPRHPDGQAVQVGPGVHRWGYIAGSIPSSRNVPRSSARSRLRCAT